MSNKKSTQNYRLVGIVNHLGKSADSGHYISDVMELVSKQWFSYNDSRVEAISEQILFEDRQKTGYIFFFLKI
jgi:ubiquitin carboxyl-terminal hydrolase 26/29/37